MDPSFLFKSTEKSGKGDERQQDVLDGEEVHPDKIPPWEVGHASPLRYCDGWVLSITFVGCPPWCVRYRTEVSIKVHSALGTGMLETVTVEQEKHRSLSLGPGG